MRALLCIVVLLNVWPVLGQTFNRRYDLRDIGRPNGAWDIEPTLSDAYLLMEVSSEDDTISPGLYFSHYAVGITKIDRMTGDKIWDKRFYAPWHGVTTGWANCCDSMPGGGVVVGGAQQDTLQHIGVLLMVFDANGDTLFTRDLDAPGQDWNPFTTKRTQDGGFIIVGQTDATGFRDGFTIKTDAQGNELWRRTYGELAPQTDGMLTAVELANGDLVLGGSKFPTNTSMTHWLIRTNSMGIPITDALWPVTPLGGGPHLTLLSSGNILLASNVPYAADFDQDVFYLAVVDPADLSVIWERQYDSAASFQVLYAAKEVPNGDLIACGVSEAIGGFQGVLLRTTADGDSLWLRRYFYQDDVISQGVGQFYDVLPTPEGGFIATGPVYSQLNQPNPPGYSQDAWVVKVDGNGCIVPGCQLLDGVEEQATNLLDALSIFPNPVASGQSVTVQLSLPPGLGNGPLQCTIVSADGRFVHTEKLNGYAGQLTTDNLSPGLYYLHITQDGKWLTGGKLVVE